MIYFCQDSGAKKVGGKLETRQEWDDVAPRYGSDFLGRMED
jgi:hypothetical protein